MNKDQRTAQTLKNKMKRIEALEQTNSELLFSLKGLLLIKKALGFGGIAWDTAEKAVNNAEGKQ